MSYKINQVNVRLSDDERSKLGDLAEVMGVSQSNVLRGLLISAHGKISRKKQHAKLVAERRSKERLRKKLLGKPRTKALKKRPSRKRVSKLRKRARKKK